MVALTHTEAENHSYEVLEGAQNSSLILVCDHASCAMPPEYGLLGLPAHETERHIGYDIGAGSLTRMLRERFACTAILTRFSRLLIDPNRGEDDPTLIMRLSDGAIVPGNARIDTAEREARLNRFYRPYNARLAALIDAHLNSGRVPVILSIHSFDPTWKGVPRPWHAGLLWDKDGRFARPLVEGLCAEQGLFVGDNEPYTGWLRNDTMYRHGTARGIAHALLEVRNDLIATPRGVLEWADRLEGVIGPILETETLYEVKHFGSHSDDPGAETETPDHDQTGQQNAA